MQTQAHSFNLQVKKKKNYSIKMVALIYLQELHISRIGVVFHMQFEA